MADIIQIWHNTRCSKSRDAFQWLADNNLECEWVDYMNQPFTKEELQAVLKKLKMSAEELIRKGEKIYKENFKDEVKSDEEWVEIMVKHPNLIERPIVIKGACAVVARPLERIEEIV